MNAGDVIFKFKGDDTDLTKKASSVSGTLGKMGKGVATGFAVAGTAIAGVSTALGGLVMKSVQMAGDLEQQIGGTEAVFKEFATGEWISVAKDGFSAVADDGTANFVSLQDVAKNAFGTMGLSANDYMATINKMGALMQGSGISTEKSMNLSAQAMQRAADVASIMGIDIDSAMESVAGAAKGNFTMMDNLGVAMNATSIEAYALSKGIEKSFNEMTKAEQVSMAMEMFLEKSAYAMGNYAKENKTFAGSLQTLKSSFANFMSGAGDVNSLIDSVLSFSDILVTKIGEMAPIIIDGIVKLINGISPKLPEMLKKLLPSVINGAVSLINGIASALPGIVIAFQQAMPMLINGITTLFTSLLGMLPVLLPMLIQMVIQIIVAIANVLPTMIPQIVDGILAMIPILIDNLPLFIKAGYQLITGILVGLINAVPTLLSYIPKIISSIMKYILQLPKMWLDIGTNMVKGLWEGIKNVSGWVLDKIKGFGKSILNGIKGIFGIHSPSTEFAFVGEMNAEGLIKGMAGMEDEVQQSFDGMFNLSPQLYGTSSMNMSPKVNVVVNNNMKQDPLGQMVNDIKSFGGGSKNDYNYGYGGA